MKRHVSIITGAMFFLLMGILYITNMPMSHSPREEEHILKEINNKDELVVIVFGNLNFSEEFKKEFRVFSISQNELEEKVLFEKTNNKIRVLIVSNELVDVYLSNKKFENIEKFLDKNIIVFFRTSDYDNELKLLDLTRDDLAEKAEVEGLITDRGYTTQITDLEYIWTAKTKSGKYITGEGFYQYNVSEERVIQDMILTAWRWHTRDRQILP